ncbi:MAG: hypothetical protein JXQ67_10755 [Campylobacterales bacterium]|nr:hypothetical protein [Campylobacterales bacterium]
MSEALERLQEIGAQKIYEKTHIPVEHVQAILHQSFDGFSKVQFLGFVSILEREYGVDLSELRAYGLQHFSSETSLEEPQGVFIVPQKKRKFTFLYILLAFVIFILVAYKTVNNSQEDLVTTTVDHTLIEDVKNNIDLPEINASVEDIEELNASVEDLNETQELSMVQVEEAKMPESLKFYTKTKIWLGYIDVATNKHYNKIFTGEFSIDANKEWLLVFGHSYVDILVDNKIVTFDTKENVRFLYKNGEVRAISLYEFKQYNRGRAW